MDEFCGSEFWNSTLSWNTSNPDLTTCFQKTVLVWTPCAFLWTFSLVEASYILHSKDKNIPWNVLSISKLFFTCLLIVLTVVDLGVSVHNSSSSDVADVEYYTPVIKILSFCLSAILLYYNRKNGLRTSGLLFMFWLLLTIFSIPQFRSEIMRESEKLDDEKNMYPFVSYMIFFPLVILMLFLNCFADLAPLESPYPQTEKSCPERKSSFLAKLLYTWFDTMAWTGYKKPLENDDLWEMNPEDCSKEVVPKFEKYWNQTVEKCGGVKTKTRASFSKASASVDFGPTKKKTTASVLPALVKAFGPTFFFGSFLKLVQDLLSFVSPQLLSLLIGFVDSDAYDWKGYLYASLLFITAVVQTFVLSQYFHRMFLVGLRIRTALISTIYKKALKLSNQARKESTVGEIVNLMSVDAQRFMDLTGYLNLIWSAPLQIILAMYFLWGILGPSVLAGLGVMILLIPINGFIANRIKTLQIRQMKNKDERVKLMNEILTGIKVLKLYAWEPSYEAQVLKIREKEIKVLKDTAYLNAATSFIWSCAPFLVSLMTLLTYSMIDENNVLTTEKVFVTLNLLNIMHLPLGLLPILIVSVIQVSLVTFATFVLSDPENNILDSKIAFVSLSLFNLLRFPLSMLPMLISNIVQTSVSVKRINKFLNSEELDPNSTLHEPDVNPLVIENGKFSWGGDEPTLHNINISISKGSLVAVVGSVGSGKSSLLSAFLGEMDKITGRVNTQGSIAYVSQQAWIQNCSLRDNILFGKEMNKSAYNKIVEACALKPDLDMLPGGDQTEIGEKGINLSGGQKQRVSLARAVYYDTDVYFLDDPLSAVDSHVGKHIFENVIGPSGVLKNKTRVLVTHSITYLPQVDNIIVLKDGEVSEMGTYKQLLEKKGAFADFLVQHLNDSGEQEELDIFTEIKHQLESSLGEKDFLTKLQRARSHSESHSESNSVDVRPSVERSISQIKKTPEKTPEKILDKKQPDKLIEAEKAETGTVKWVVFAHYIRSIGVFLATSTILMNMTYQAFAIGSNYWLAIWSEDELLINNPSENLERRDMYLGVYGGMGLAQVITTSVSSLTLFLGTLEASRLLHELMLHTVFRAPSTTFFDVTPVGRILNRFSKDVDILDNVLPMTIRGWVSCFFSVLGTFVVISISTPIFVAVIIPIGILYYFVQRFYVASSRQLKRLESISRSPIYSHFGETVQGVSVIRAYGMQERFINESESKVDFNQLSYYPSIIANRWLAIRLEMMSNLIILFAALFAVISRDTIAAGLVGLSVSYALQVTQTFNWLVRMTSDVETNIVAVERIREYGDANMEAPWEIAQTTPNKDWPSKGHIRIDKLVMKYRDNTDPVLHGITCEVMAGEKVGIVGRTGAGKSTLTLALFRIVEAHSGKIFIDNIDISTLGLHSLRSRITIIPQDPVLFSGSMRSNLDPFEAYSDDEVWRALEHAHLKAFVKGLPAGLNHVISEGGENLSVGQRQLICLARALLRKTQLLILDEATAAVDLETDDLIQRTIRSEFASCTVLTIAHRLNTIMDSNRVLVLDKGRLAEFDAPTTLLQNKKSIFYGMAKDAGLVN